MLVLRQVPVGGLLERIKIARFHKPLFCDPPEQTLVDDPLGRLLGARARHVHRRQRVAQHLFGCIEGRELDDGLRMMLGDGRVETVAGAPRLREQARVLEQTVRIEHTRRAPDTSHGDCRIAPADGIPNPGDGTADRPRLCVGQPAGE